jgi:hypothetical protein
MKIARRALVVVAVLGLLAAAYRLGYEAGLKAKEPDHRALMIVRRDPGSTESKGTSALWFDVSQPGEAIRMQEEEARLRASGAEYYATRGVVEKRLRPAPRVDRVNSQR